MAAKPSYYNRCESEFRPDPEMAVAALQDYLEGAITFGVFVTKVYTATKPSSGGLQAQDQFLEHVLDMISLADCKLCDIEQCRVDAPVYRLALLHRELLKIRGKIWEFRQKVLDLREVWAQQ